MATVSFEHVYNRKNLKNSKNKPYYFRKKKKPLVLEFDEAAREEFLTGFRKRKLQRKKQATEVLEQQLKEERKRIRLEAKHAYKKLVVTNRDIPELSEICGDADIVDMDTHEVQVTELDPDRLARENNWIGANRIKYEEPEAKEEKVEIKVESGVEGMDLKPKIKKLVEKKATELKTEKDVKKFVKRVATKNVQKSKIFQKKKDVEARKNKKKMRREDRNREKNSKKTKSKREKRRN